jgi:hypothetical protein
VPFFFEELSEENFIVIGTESREPRGRLGLGTIFRLDVAMFVDPFYC